MEHVVDGQTQVLFYAESVRWWCIEEYPRDGDDMITPVELWKLDYMEGGGDDESKLKPWVKLVDGETSALLKLSNLLNCLD